jgi:hypothetical protein
MFGRKYRLPTVDPTPTLSTQLHRIGVALRKAKN